MGGNALAGTLAVLAFDDGTELVHRKAMTSHLHQRAHDGAHHIAQEAVGRNGEAPLVRAYFLPIGFADVADIGLLVVIDLAETGEILVLHHAARSLVHQREIQFLEQLPAIMSLKGLFAQMDMIMIGAAGGREACVQIVGNVPHTLHGDVARQQAIQFIHKLRAVNGSVGIEMCHHHGGMYARICAAGTRYGRVPAQQRAQGFLQGFLHGRGTGLHLPSVVSRAVVG